MATREDWIYLGKEFKRLQKTCRIHAVYYPEARDGTQGVRVHGVDGEWDLRGESDLWADAKASEIDAPAFERLARAAAVAAGCPDHPRGYVFWLEGIRANGLGEREDQEQAAILKVRQDQSRARAWKARLARLASGKLKLPQDQRPVPGSWKLGKDHEIHYSAICKTSARYCQLIAAGAVSPPSSSGWGRTQIERTLPRPTGSKGEPCTWAKVHIHFVDSNKVALDVNGRKLGRMTFDDMGFADGRKGRKDANKKEANVAWLLLEALAMGIELDAGAPKRNRPKNNAAAEFHRAMRNSEDWTPLPPAAHGHLRKPVSVPKNIQKARNLLKKAIERHGFVVPIDSDPLPFVDGKYHAHIVLSHYKPRSG